LEEEEKRRRWESDYRLREARLMEETQKKIRRGEKKN